MFLELFDGGNLLFGVFAIFTWVRERKKMCTPSKQHIRIGINWYTFTIYGYIVYHEVTFLRKFGVRLSGTRSFCLGEHFIFISTWNVQCFGSIFRTFACVWADTGCPCQPLFSSYSNRFGSCKIILKSTFDDMPLWV